MRKDFELPEYYKENIEDKTDEDTFFDMDLNKGVHPADYKLALEQLNSIKGKRMGNYGEKVAQMISMPGHESKKYMISMLWEVSDEFSNYDDIQFVVTTQYNSPINYDDIKNVDKISAHDGHLGVIIAKKNPEIDFEGMPYFSEFEKIGKNEIMIFNGMSIGNVALILAYLIDEIRTYKEKEKPEKDINPKKNPNRNRFTEINIPEEKSYDELYEEERKPRFENLLKAYDKIIKFHKKAVDDFELQPLHKNKRSSCNKFSKLIKTSVTREVQDYNNYENEEININPYDYNKEINQKMNEENSFRQDLLHFKNAIEEGKNNIYELFDEIINNLIVLQDLGQYKNFIYTLKILPKSFIMGCSDKTIKTLTDLLRVEISENKKKTIERIIEKIKYMNRLPNEQLEITYEIVEPDKLNPKILKRLSNLRLPHEGSDLSSYIKDDLNYDIATARNDKKENIKKPRTFFVFAWNNKTNDIVGWILFKIEGTFLDKEKQPYYISRMDTYVDEAFRNRGISTKMYDFVKAKLNEYRQNFNIKSPRGYNPEEGSYIKDGKLKDACDIFFNFAKKAVRDYEIQPFYKEKEDTIRDHIEGKIKNLPVVGRNPVFRKGSFFLDKIKWKPIKTDLFRMILEYDGHSLPDSFETITKENFKNITMYDGSLKLYLSLVPEKTTEYKLSKIDELFDLEAHGTHEFLGFDMTISKIVDILVQVVSASKSVLYSEDKKYSRQTGIDLNPIYDIGKDKLEEEKHFDPDAGYDPTEDVRMNKRKVDMPNMRFRNLEIRDVDWDDYKPEKTYKK